MTEKQVEIVNKTGLHARPAAAFTKFCSQYENEIILLNGDMEINAKSILQVLAAGLAKGTKLRVRVIGVNSEIVGQKVVEYIESLEE